MSFNSEISLAVRRALWMGAVATAGTSALTLPTTATAQETTEADDSELTVTVTGSRIRRVDEETAEPVFVLDSEQITRSGVSTVGEFIQRIPAISGAASNPQVNNGGGTGEAQIELRGLQADRTLVLLNGRRLGVLGRTGTVSATDINTIPIAIIERVEVLKEGAGAVYGSDAIAGVVNFITRKDFSGLEVGAKLGATSRGDGQDKGINASWGSSTEKGSMSISGSFTQQDEVSANDRDFSRFALYLYGGVESVGGSSRTPTGRIFLPGVNDDGTFEAGSLADQFGCGDVTRIANATGDNLNDYRCFEGSDLYNYQPFNLLLTPQERFSLFTQANYNVSENVESYAEVLFTRTRSGFQIAPLPFDAVNDDVIVSADNVYNPFGIDFGGGSGANPQALWRLEGLGNRRSDAATNSMSGNLGLRGAFFDTSWRWDLNAGFGRVEQLQDIQGYLFKSRLEQALGASFIDTDGTPTCGTPGNPIAGCTPLNVFSLDPNDESQIAAFNEFSTNYITNYNYDSTALSLNFDGTVVALPAGDMLAAIGMEYREQEGVFETDILSQGVPPLFLTCLLAQETCSGDSAANYNNKEFYGELFLPLLADMPGAKALNLKAGIRYSDYSQDTIGSSTNAQIKLEYRPVGDLLVRASFAEVFRAPTILDLSLAPTQTASTFNDPCIGITAADVAANPNLALACENVPLGGSFEQANSQVTGLLIGNPELKPETGDVFNYGLVYDPSQIRGLSFTVDVWRYKIDDLISAVDVNFAADQCVATGASTFCDLIFRFGPGENAGQIQVFRQPNLNLGTLETNGVDLGVRYTTPQTASGKWTFTADATRIRSYENVPEPGAVPVEVVGTYSRQFGNYAKWRGLVSARWELAAFDAAVVARYIDNIRLDEPDGAGIDPNPALNIKSYTYLDLTLGYNVSDKTRLQVGAINLSDEEPPILYQNNVTNANTDVETYDLLGRRWFLNINHKF
jgi:iron complex outermembrane recepter protein